MEKERWNKIREIVQQIEKKKWAQEMDDVEMLIVNKTWKSRGGYYMGKTRQVFISGNKDLAGIKRTILHELAHHIEYRHAKGFIRYKGVCHSRNFHIIFRCLLSNYNYSLREIIDKLYSYPERGRGWKWNKAKTDFVFERW